MDIAGWCRALDGDVVAVELLPESQWKGERSSLPQADAESTNGGDEEDGDDPEGGHIAPQVRAPTYITTPTHWGDLKLTDRGFINL